MNRISRGKTLTLVVLATIAVALGIANILLASPGRTPAVRGDGRQGTREGIDAAIDAELIHYGIPLSTVRRIAIRPAGGAIVRWEIRARVPAGFPSLLMNHDLSVRLQPLGARVIGTEHTPQGRVSFHIRKDGVVVRSIVLLETG